MLVTRCWSPVVRTGLLVALALGSFLSHAVNLIPNPSFEFVVGGEPLGWAWVAGAAKGRLTLDPDGAFDGRQAVHIANDTPHGPNVFSSLRTTVPVQPDTTYTLSAYVRGEAPGIAWIGGGPGWLVRMALPEGALQWQRIQTVFTTDPGQTRFDLLINTDSPTAGFWVDAVQLEEGDQAMAFDTGLSPGDIQLEILPGRGTGLGENLIPNPSFEIVDGARPKGWIWDSRNTDATFSVVADACSGENAIRITNGTESSPHVYGQVVLLGGVTLDPGETYTLSLACKSTDPGAAWVGGGDGWWLRLPLKGTGGTWQRFTKTFTARTADRIFALMINTDSPTQGFLVDDVKLEQGAQATPFVDEALLTGGGLLMLNTPETVSFPNASGELMAMVYRGAGTAVGAPLTVTIRDLAGDYSRSAVCPTPLAEGMNALRVHWAPPNEATGSYTMRLAFGEVEEESTFVLYTGAQYRQAYTRAAADAARLDEALTDALEHKLQAPYAQAAAVVWRRFSAVANSKVAVGKVAEAMGDVAFLADLCRAQTARLAALRSGEATAMEIRDPPVDSLHIADGEFRSGDDPVMLVGGLGYGELLNEIESYRDYGFNVIGDDFNAYSALNMITGDDSIDESVLPRLKASWKALATKNLTIAYNPTLHYFPEWALTQYPDITGGDPVDCLPDWSGLERHAGKRTKAYGGFFPFAIDSPSVRRLVSRYYAELMPGIRDLQPFRITWLMNEPTYKSTDPNYLGLYRQTLSQHYASIERLNQRWNAEFMAFDDVPPALEPGQPGRYDWLTFHQDQVASWFEWLAAEIKRHDPGAILSNKPMAWTFLNPDLGIDFEREAVLWEVPGCDAGRSPGDASYAFGWRSAAMLFDFQKSVAPGKPLADHEYHYVHEPNVTSEYVRASYFHSYLHGLRMSQFWVWATGQLGEGAVGAGMAHTAWSQPRVAWGTATSALDLRRLAPVVALFPQPSEMSIYLSRASLYVDTAKHRESLTKAYETATFLDAPVGFVTDRMMLDGALATTKLLILPHVSTIEPEQRRLVAQFVAAGGHVVATGPVMTSDPYGKAYPDPVAGPNLRLSTALTRSSLEDALAQAGVTRLARGLSPDGGISDVPVEVRGARLGERCIMYVAGLAKQETSIRLQWDGSPIRRWHDLLSGEEGRGPTLVVEPLSIRLLEVE